VASVWEQSEQELARAQVQAKEDAVAVPDESFYQQLSKQ